MSWSIYFLDPNCNRIEVITYDRDVVMDLSNGEQIVVVDHFRGIQWDMEEFVFADGTVLGANDLILA